MAKLETGWLGRLAIITMFLGLIVGGWALAAPLGVWGGAWDFRQGFRILLFAMGHAPYATIVCLGTGLILFILGRVRYARFVPSLLILPVAGAVVSGLAWYIPDSYMVQVPAIHDVSTDVVNPPQYLAVLPLRASAPNTTEYGAKPEKNADLQQQAYPDIRPRYYDASEAEIFERAMAVVAEMGWHLHASVAAEGRIEATDTTFWFRFEDDVVIRITRDNDKTRLDARSLSRVGDSDLGRNASRLRDFFERMNR